MTEQFESFDLNETFFTADELAWVRKYGPALDELVRGLRSPKTDAQASFLRVVRGDAPPLSPAEQLWVRVLLAREVTQLRTKIAARDALLESVASVRSSILIQELGIEFFERSNHPAMLRVGADHYLKNDSTDPTKTFALALQASQLGDGQSSYIVGMLYEYGIGISEDRNEANKFYRLAVKRGVEEAQAKIFVKPSLPSAKENHLLWPSPKSTSRESEDDWNNGDDFDSGAWEQILGGPEEAVFEREE
ncbi:DUF413 domain-containing protein [Silvimonas amylolytica]|uniref:Macrodomain Ori protein n=1 Tax=Silvimonas amylolytica TaxID=449663 RepID=A0ABQ2PNF0_9NEIS|nr:DUF413 domain-containing protein [Silvimonas amylolytica]GGP26838.1 hypothetical protein GCM10010971_26570 [Silvimonas amylolytica]